MLKKVTIHLKIDQAKIFTKKVFVRKLKYQTEIISTKINFRELNTFKDFEEPAPYKTPSNRRVIIEQNYNTLEI